MVIAVKYYGPTSSRGTRLRAWAYGYKPKWYKRDFSLSPFDDCLRAAQDYAKGLGMNVDSVRAAGRIDADTEIFVGSWR